RSSNRTSKPRIERNAPRISLHNPLPVRRMIADGSRALQVVHLTQKKGRPQAALFDSRADRAALLRRRQLRRLRRLLGRLLLALGEDERVALEGDLAQAIHLGTGTGRNEPADDDVLLEP